MRPSWHELRRQQKRQAAELESSSQSQSRLEVGACNVSANAYALDAAEGAAPETCEDSPAFDYEKPDSDDEFIAAGGVDLPIAGGIATPLAGVDGDEAGRDTPIADAQRDDGGLATPLAELDNEDDEELLVPDHPVARRPTVEEYQERWKERLAHHCRVNNEPFSWQNLVPAPKHVLWQDCPHVPFEELKSEDAQARLSTPRDRHLRSFKSYERCWE